MERVSVLLASGSKLLDDLLQQMIESHECVYAARCYSRAPEELLLHIKRHRADAVVLSMDETESMPGICSHLFHEYPELVVIALSPNGDRATVLRQTVVRDDIHEVTANSLLTILSDAAVGYWSC